ncbi:MAG: hypothetical protein ACK4YF_07160 [Exilispira sp.]
MKNGEIFKKSLFSHIKKYPMLRFEDIYKFLFQAVCGNAHLLESKEKFIKHLNCEIDNIKKDSGLKIENKFENKNDVNNIRELFLNKSFDLIILDNEPLMEILRDDKKYVRINLRPYIKLGLDLNVLKNVCILSAEENSKNEKEAKDEFVKLWNKFSNSIYDKSFFIEYAKYCNDNSEKVLENILSIELLNNFNSFIENKNYPLIHHSEQYLFLYKPAYRVVDYDKVKLYL